MWKEFFMEVIHNVLLKEIKRNQVQYTLLFQLYVEVEKGKQKSKYVEHFVWWSMSREAVVYFILVEEFKLFFPPLTQRL